MKGRVPPALIRSPFSAAEFRSRRRQQLLTQEYFDLNTKWLRLSSEGALSVLTERRLSAEFSPLGQRLMFFNCLNDVLLSYTAGEAIESLQPKFAELMTWFGAWHFGFQEYLSKIQEEDPASVLRIDSSPLEIDESLEDFHTAITLASLAVLMGDADALQDVAGFLSEYRQKDMLLEGVLEPVMPEASVVETFYHRVPYDPLLDAVYVADTDADASAMVQKYLDGWYKAFEGTRWHDGHLAKAADYIPYYGYWSFEAAAVCVIYGIEDAGFRDHIVYPKDFADWARQNNSIGKLKAGASQRAAAPRLRCVAGQACPRAGFWFTPARANSRRHFNQGEPMPDVGGDYGVTIWQWDAQQ